MSSEKSLTAGEDKNQMSKRHKPHVRWLFCTLIIVGSIAYGALVSYDTDLARSIMLGYIGAVLTFFVLFECWRPHD